MSEKEIVAEMHKREEPDSLELTYGTPAKGAQVKLKTYFNALKVSKNKEEPQGEAEIKVENLLKLRQLLINKNLIQ